jgi:chromosome segregation ATPase
MSTACYDRKPDPPRQPIAIAGDLVRRSDKLSNEGAKCITTLQARVAELERERDESRRDWRLCEHRRLEAEQRMHNAMQELAAEREKGERLEQAEAEWKQERERLIQMVEAGNAIARSDAEQIARLTGERNALTAEVERRLDYDSNIALLENAYSHLTECRTALGIEEGERIVADSGRHGSILVETRTGARKRISPCSESEVRLEKENAAIRAQLAAMTKERDEARAQLAAANERAERETIETIAKWGEEAFGPISTERAIERAWEEWREMIEPGADTAMEAADVVICLARIPGLAEAVQRKMAINRNRQWNLKGDGTGYHVKPDPASPVEPAEQPPRDEPITAQ